MKFVYTGILVVLLDRSLNFIECIEFKNLPQKSNLFYLDNDSKRSVKNNGYMIHKKFIFKKMITKNIRQIFASRLFEYQQTLLVISINHYQFWLSLALCMDKKTMRVSPFHQS